MSWFGWLGKRIIIGVVITGVGAAAWNWYKQGDENGARAALHDEPEKPKAEPQNCQSGPERELAQPSHKEGLSPPSHTPVMANDGWPAGVRQLRKEAQRKQLYIYLPPNISREEAERW